MSEISEIVDQLRESSDETPSRSGRTEAEKLAAIALLHSQVRRKIASSGGNVLSSLSNQQLAGAGAGVATALGGSYLMGRMHGASKKERAIHEEADRNLMETGVRTLSRKPR